MTAAEQKADKLLSIRMTPDQRAQVESRADVEALAASTWARDALLMLAAGELSLHDIEVAVQEARARRTAPDPERKVVGRGVSNRLGRRELLDGRCLHPVHLRIRKQFYDECPCGEKFRR